MLPHERDFITWLPSAWSLPWEAWALYWGCAWLGKRSPKGSGERPQTGKKTEWKHGRLFRRGCSTAQVAPSNSCLDTDVLETLPHLSIPVGLFFTSLVSDLLPRKCNPNLPGVLQEGLWKSWMLMSGGRVDYQRWKSCPPKTPPNHWLNRLRWCWPLQKKLWNFSCIAFWNPLGSEIKMSLFPSNPLSSAHPWPSPFSSHLPGLVPLGRSLEPISLI